MKAELPALPNRHWHRIRWIVKKVLPRGNRDDHLDGLEVKQKRRSLTAHETASTIARVYWDHAVAAFNRWGVFLNVILVVFCFGGSALPWQLSILLAADLIVLALRDGWTHHDVRNDAQPLVQYYLDGVTDGVVAGVFMLVSGMLAFRASPALVQPIADLYRGAVVCLPLMMTLRIALRPKPDTPNAAYEGPNLTAEQIYWRTWRLNILWLLTFYGLVAQNVTGKHHYTPDTIRGAVLGLIGLWYAVQTGAPIGRKWIQILCSKLRKTKLERMYRSLPKGLRKGEPRYRRYVILEAAIYLVMGISLAEALWPWLSGDTTHADLFRAIGSIIAFATVILSWNCVKVSNRAAARAILAEINRIDV